MSERKLRKSHPGVQYELPLGLVARIQLRLVRIVECLIGEGACLVFNHSCSVILCLVHILFLPRGWRLNSSSEVCSWRGCIEVLLPENILKQQVQRIPEDSEIKNI